jgi:hypothetical protein
MAYSLDDSWDNCTPVARAGNACFGLYVRCGIWVARNLTDGFVPGEIATAYGSPEQIRKLVDVGLWETAEGGYQVPDYLERNPAAEKVRARQKADAERKARWRDRHHSKRRTRDETRESAGSHAVTDAVSPLSPTPLRGRGGRASDPPPDNPDWRTLKAFGQQPDPELAERTTRRIADARAAVRHPNTDPEGRP